MNRDFYKDVEYERYEEYVKAIKEIVNDEKKWKEWKEGRDPWLWQKGLEEASRPPKTREEKLWTYIWAYEAWTGEPWDPEPWIGEQN